MIAQWKFVCYQLLRHPVGRLFLLSPTLLVFTPDLGSAREYDSLRPKYDRRTVTPLRQAMNQASRNAADFQTGKKQFSEYWGNYHFRRMTLYSPNELATLSKKRDQLIVSLRKLRVLEAQKRLTDISLTFGRGISRGNYHPAVRYNMALVLGMLDKKYATDDTPPVPLPEATLALVELLEQDQFTTKDKTVKVTPPVKAAALVGLERHARFGISAEHGERVTKAALAVIESTERDEEVSKKVHHWMKGLAARVLSRQFRDGPTPEVQQAITQLIADDKMNLEDRCLAAEQLKEMEFTAGSGIDNSATVLALGKLAKEVAAVEYKESQEFEKEALEGGGFSTRRRGGGFGGRDLDVPKYPRRRILSRLFCIYEGAKSLAKGLEEGEKQQLQDLRATIAAVLKVIGDEDSVDLDVTDSVKKFKRSVDSLVSGWEVALNDSVLEDVALASR